MNEIKLTRDQLGDAFDSLEEGGTIEVCATLKVTSKSDSEVSAEVSEVEPYDPVDEEDEAEGDEVEAPTGKSKSGKGMGILVTFTKQ